MRINYTHSKDGMTLVEVVLALAIIGIIAVALLGPFTFAFTQINQAGHKSIAGFKAQEATDQEISGVSVNPGATIAPVPTTLTINLPVPLSTPIEQDGEIITVTTDSNGKNSVIKTFISDN